MKKTIRSYKSLDEDKKVKLKEKCLILIKRKKNLESRLNNLIDHQFEIDQAYIKVGYIKDKKEIVYESLFRIVLYLRLKRNRNY